MNKKNIADFFDNCAPWWDDDMIRNEEIIERILDNGGIVPGVRVLDVACGTGVLFPDYLSRGVASVTGIDISPEMVRIASQKYPQVKVICGDVETMRFEEKFDRIMVYNAFPHFPDPQRLVQVLAGLLDVGGRLSVAHGMSRAALLDHHAGRASSVSIDLIHETDLADIFSKWFDVDVVISDDKMYQVSGIRNTAEISPTTPNDEIRALLSYMIGHNNSHTDELVSLACQINDAGSADAYRQIMEAVGEFEAANTRLSAALDALSE